MGLNFCGALAYANDIVLIAPTASAMRKMLSVCESFAARFDIQFNVQKSKCMIVSVRKWRSLRSIKVFDVCHFYLDGNLVSHLSLSKAIRI